MKNLTTVTALASILVLGLAACSAGVAEEASSGQAGTQAPAPSDEANANANASPATPAMPTTTSVPTSGGNASTGGSGGGGATGPAPIAKHCPATAAATMTCLENVEGHAGDVVAIEVHLVPSATCTIADEGYARFDLPATGFALVNDADQVSCISRYENPAQGPDPASIWWQGFGVNDIASCPNQFGIGKVDTILVQIQPGTAPGDYVMHMEETDFLSRTAGCQNFDNADDFTIRVLP